MAGNLFDESFDQALNASFGDGTAFYSGPTQSREMLVGIRGFAHCKADKITTFLRLNRVERVV